MLSNKVRGLILTLNSLGVETTIKEALRRVLGLSYNYKGIPIDSDSSFRIVRNLVYKGYNVYRLEGEIIVATPFGEIGVSILDYNLLVVLLEPLEEMYGYINVDGAIVIDIGAYLGETALFFVKKGARRVYAFEPVKTFYEYLVKNNARNNVKDKIIPLDYGAWFRDTILKVSFLGASTGHWIDYSHPSVEFEVRDLKNILEIIYSREGVIDLVKMDCEGCEYSLLTLNEEYIRLCRQYIIEIHGCETLLIDKMTQAGYNSKLILKLGGGKKYISPL